MIHDPEFSEPRGEGREQMARELAACYARVFLGDEDGKRVLGDLRRKFGTHRLVFRLNSGGQFDAIEAALRDGERRVLHEIESALSTGAPGQGVAEPKP